MGLLWRRMLKGVGLLEDCFIVRGVRLSVVAGRVSFDGPVVLAQRKGYMGGPSDPSGIFCLY